MKTRFVYTAIRVKRMNRSVKFYTALLGMALVSRKKVKETDGEMCVLKSGNNRLELNQYFDEPFPRQGTLDHLAFQVSNLGKFIQTAKDHELRIHDYLVTRNWKRCFIQDPDGNWIEVFERLRQK
jgi:catechol 2,3-dioxygenase-like lactoylglutathione lyase family enzyme